MKVTVRILLILSVSAVSLVIAQRVLTGFEASVDGMPVATGPFEDGEVGVEAVTLDYDHGAVDYAFGRRVDCELVLATIEHGTERLEGFLVRLRLAYDPRRRPTDHPDDAGDACSTCHLPNEIEQAFERSQGVVLAVDVDTVVGDDLPDVHVGDSTGRPAGHPDAAAGSCPSCHGGSSDTATTPSLPGDHPSTGGQPCTSCHESPTGPGEGDEEDDEFDEDED